MKLTLKYKNKKFNFDVEQCNWLKRFFGLMFTHREKAKSLLFDFKKPMKIGIHSYFVFFDFIAVWLDDKNKILDVKKVKPFTFFIKPKKAYSKLIEVPVSKKYRGIIKILDK